MKTILKLSVVLIISGLIAQPVHGMGGGGPGSAGAAGAPSQTIQQSAQMIQLGQRLPEQIVQIIMKALKTFISSNRPEFPINERKLAAIAASLRNIELPSSEDPCSAITKFIWEQQYLSFCFSNYQPLFGELTPQQRFIQEINRAVVPFLSPNARLLHGVNTSDPQEIQSALAAGADQVTVQTAANLFGAHLAETDPELAQQFQAVLQGQAELDPDLVAQVQRTINQPQAPTQPAAAAAAVPTIQQNEPQIGPFQQALNNKILEAINHQDTEALRRALQDGNMYAVDALEYANQHQATPEIKKILEQEDRRLRIMRARVFPNEAAQLLAGIAPEEIQQIRHQEAAREAEVQRRIQELYTPQPVTQEAPRVRQPVLAAQPAAAAVRPAEQPRAETPQNHIRPITPVRQEVVQAQQPSAEEGARKEQELIKRQLRARAERERRRVSPAVIAAQPPVCRAEDQPVGQLELHVRQPGEYASEDERRLHQLRAHMQELNREQRMGPGRELGRRPSLCNRIMTWLGALFIWNMHANMQGSHISK